MSVVYGALHHYLMVLVMHWIYWHWISMVLVSDYSMLLVFYALETVKSADTLGYVTIYDFGSHGMGYMMT